MATLATYLGNGSNRFFNITFPYRSVADIRVTVDGAAVDFTLASASAVLTAVAPAANSAVVVYRKTPFNTPDVDFQDNAVLTENDLDTSQGQLFNRIQEIGDGLVDLGQRALTYPGTPSLRANSFLGFDGQGAEKIVPAGTFKGDKGDRGDVGPAGPNRPVYSSRAAVLLDTVPAGTDFLDVLGYDNPGDVPRFSYRRLGGSPPSGMTGNAGYIQDLSGAWFALVVNAGYAYLEWFGGRNGATLSGETVLGTPSAKAYNDALAFFQYAPGYKAWSKGLEIKGLFGRYRMEAPLNMHIRHTFKGMGGGFGEAGFGSATELVWPGNMPSIFWNSGNTHNGTAVPFESYGGSSEGSVMQDVGIRQANTQFHMGADGMDIRIPIELLRVTFWTIGDTAIRSITNSGANNSTEGNANHARFNQVYVHSSFGDGVNFGGADSNVMHFTDLEIHDVAGCGIIASPYFVSKFDTTLVNKYGNTAVSFGGRIWTWIKGPGRFTNTAQPGTNSDWLDIGPDVGSTYGITPWSASATYFLTVPVWSPGQFTTFDILYIEGQNVPAYIAGTIDAMSGNIQYANNGPEQAGHRWAITGIGLVNSGGVGGLTNFVPGGALASKFGGYMGSTIGSYSYAAVGPAILQYQRAIDSNGSPYSWYYDGADQVLSMFNQKPLWVMTGVNTTKDFGTGEVQPHMFSVYDIGFLNTRDFYNTKFGATITLPNGKKVAKGETYINQNMAAGGTAFYGVTTGGIIGSTAVVKNVPIGS